MSSIQPFKHQWNIVIRADSNQGAMDAAWACWKAWRDNAQPVSGNVPEGMGDRMEYFVRKVDPNHEERPADLILGEVVKLGQELREVARFVGSSDVKAVDVLRAHDAREAWDRDVWQTQLKPLTSVAELEKQIAELRKTLAEVTAHRDRLIDSSTAAWARVDDQS